MTVTKHVGLTAMVPVLAVKGPVLEDVKKPVLVTVRSVLVAVRRIDSEDVVKPARLKSVLMTVERTVNVTLAEPVPVVVGNIAAENAVKPVPVTVGNIVLVAVTGPVLVFVGIVLEAVTGPVLVPS